jgi:hypothetical protein
MTTSSPSATIKHRATSRSLRTRLAIAASCCSAHTSYLLGAGPSIISSVDASFSKIYCFLSIECISGDQHSRLEISSATSTASEYPETMMVRKRCVSRWSSRWIGGDSRGPPNRGKELPRMPLPRRCLTTSRDHFSITLYNLLGTTREHPRHNKNPHQHCEGLPCFASPPTPTNPPSTTHNARHPPHLPSVPLPPPLRAFQHHQTPCTTQHPPLRRWDVRQFP